MKIKKITKPHFPKTKLKKQYIPPFYDYNYHRRHPQRKLTLQDLMKNNHRKPQNINHINIYNR